MSLQWSATNIQDRGCAEDRRHKQKKHDELYNTLSGSYILAHKSFYYSYTSRSRKMNRERKRLHWLTLVFPKGCWSLNIVILFQLCPLAEMVCATDGAPSPACQGGPTGRWHVCRHSDWGTAVPADQFGERTYIKRGKGSGGMKGISTSPEQVVVGE